jgi:arsenate reductase (thioredoxin)
MFQSIKEQCDELVNQFLSLPEERKKVLQQIAEFVQTKKDQHESSRLMYVCTHNSRRSHFGQVWSKVAATYYGISDVETYSGGTEATAFNPNAIKALVQSGFKIIKENETANPTYRVYFSDLVNVNCFSKVYDDARNPSKEFAAIMTCSDAEENCPFIPGVELRVATTYDDPKAFDGTELQEVKYLERSKQIALECLYVFSLIK